MSLKLFLIILLTIMSKIEKKSIAQPSKVNQKQSPPPTKPREKMPSIQRNEPSHDLRKTDLVWANDKSYLRRKLNEGDIMEKSVVIARTKRIIQDNPQYLMSNSDFYSRNLYHSVRKEYQPNASNFDVLNNPKTSTSGRNEDFYYTNMTLQNSRRSSNNSHLRKTLTHMLAFQPEVAAKVGSTNTRNFAIPRPQLKIGSSEYIDTYSPF